MGLLRAGALLAAVTGAFSQTFDIAGLNPLLAACGAAPCGGVRFTSNPGGTVQQIDADADVFGAPGNRILDGTAGGTRTFAMGRSTCAPGANCVVNGVAGVVGSTVVGGNTIMTCNGAHVLDVTSTGFRYTQTAGGADGYTLKMDFRTAPLGADATQAAPIPLTAPTTVEMACQLIADDMTVLTELASAGAVNTFVVLVQVFPFINQPPIVALTPAATTTVISEDNSGTPTSPAMCQTLNIAMTMAVTQEVHEVGFVGTPHPVDGGMGSTVQLQGCSINAAGTTCPAGAGLDCLTSLGVTPDGAAGTDHELLNVQFDYCLEPDAAGTVAIDCVFEDSGQHCCRTVMGALTPSANKCPLDLIAACAALPRETVTAQLILTIEEVNDPPYAYIDVTGGTAFVWQEDCGLTGYDVDCLTAGASQPNFPAVRLQTAAMTCPATTSTITYPVSGALTNVLDMCTAGGANGAIGWTGGGTDFQGSFLAFSESDQTATVVVEVDDASLFLNGGGGCPGCGGVTPCGCPTIDTNGLTWIPAKDAIGLTNVKAFIIDGAPAVAGATVGTTTLGGVSAAETGQYRRSLPDMTIEMTEVNDPPSIDFNFNTIATPPSMAAAANPVDRLPRMVFRQDPAWAGPTQTAGWAIAPDAYACVQVDCCLDDPTSVSEVSVTGHKTSRPANAIFPASTTTHAIKDCPLARQGTCCVLNDMFIIGGALACNTAGSLAACKLLPGCSWDSATNFCTERGYADPLNSDTASPTANDWVGRASASSGPGAEGRAFQPNMGLANVGWDQQWNLKCKAECSTGNTPVSFYGPGVCDDQMFNGGITPYALSMACYDNHAACAGTTWPVNRPAAGSLVFKQQQSAIPGFGGEPSRRGSTRMVCQAADEPIPDATQACPAVPNNQWGSYKSGCQDTATFAGSPATCTLNGVTAPAPAGVPCPGFAVPDQLASKNMEFIIEFTAPTYTLSDFPTAGGLFDTTKNPWWEVLVLEDALPVVITSFLKNPQVWADGAAITANRGTVTVTPHDTTLFQTASQPTIANLLPPQGGDLQFHSVTDISGHTWVVVGLSDDGGGDPSQVNGPTYDEFVLWVREVNDAPTATLDPAVVPQGTLNINEDTAVVTGSTYQIINDLSAGPDRETRPQPATGGACPLTNTFPGCGVIPITTADATAVNWNLVQRPRLCAQTCGTGAGCGCGQQVQSICTAADTTLFATQPAVSAAAGTEGQLTFKLAADMYGATEVTCDFKDCIDPVGGVCTTTSDGEAALTTTVRFTVDIMAINDPPTLSLQSAGLQVNVNEDSGVHTATVLMNISPGPGPEMTAQTVTVDCSVKIGQSSLFTGPLTTTVTGAVGSAQLGSITFTPAPDQSGTATVNCQASDNGAPQLTTTSSSFDIVIAEVNDPPSGTLLTSVITVVEDSGLYTSKLIDNLIAGPPSEQLLPQTLTVTCSPNDATLFAAAPTVSTSGFLSFTPAADAVGSTLVNCVFVDNGTPVLSFTTTFTIVITEVNDPPTVTVNGVSGSPTITVNEGTATVSAPNFLTNVAAGPASEQLTQTVFFQCTVDNPNLFDLLPAVTILGTTGTVTFTPKTDAAGMTVVTCDAVDTGTPVLTASINFNVVITEVNDAPIVTVTQNPVTVIEDADPVVIPGFLAPFAPGPESEQSQTMSITCTPADASYFAVPPSIDSVGTLSYTLNPDLSGMVSVSCTILDNGVPARSTMITFDIEIQEVNDAPTVVQTGTLGVFNEDTGLNTVANFWTSLAAGPPQEVAAGQTYTYACTYTNPTLFVPGREPAVAVVGTAASMSFEAEADAAGESVLTCTIQDDGVPTAFTTVNYTITVRDINDAPSGLCGVCGSASGVSIAEDSGFVSLASFVQRLTPGPASEASQGLSIVCSSTNMALWISDPSVSPPIDGSPSIDAMTGELTFTAEADTSGTAVVTCTLRDDGAPLPQQSVTWPPFTIEVREVNDRPMGILEPGSRLSYPTGTGATAVKKWVTEIAPGPTQEAAQTLTMTCVADMPSLFVVQPAVSVITGELTFTPTSTAVGESTVVCDLTDNGVPAETLTLTFDLAFENQPPTADVTAPLVVVSEDTGLYQFSTFLTDLTPGPLIEVSLGQTVTRIDCAAVDAALFATQPALDVMDGELSLTTFPDAVGVTDVTCTIYDSGLPQRSVPVMFTVNVTEVNDAPVAAVLQPTLIMVEGGNTATFNKFVEVRPGPDSEWGQMLNATCQVTSSGPSIIEGSFTVDTFGWNQANPYLTFQGTPSRDTSGSAEVQCIIVDDGTPALSTTIAFTMNVTEVNDPPQATLAMPLVQVNEDDPNTMVAGVFTGVSPGPAAEVQNGQRVVMSCVAADPSLFRADRPPVMSVAGDLSFQLTPDAVGTTTVTCTAEDTGAPPLSVSHAFTVEIMEMNDPPLVNTTQDRVVVFEDSGRTTMPNMFVPFAPGPASEAAQLLNTSCRAFNTLLFANVSFFNPNDIYNQSNITVVSNGPKRGELTFLIAPDMSGESRVECVVQDNGSPSLTATFDFEIEVIEVNDPPTGRVPNTAVVVTEDAGAVTVPNFLVDTSPGLGAEAAWQVLATNCSVNAALTKYSFAAAPAIDEFGTLSFAAGLHASGKAVVDCVMYDNGVPQGTLPFTFSITSLEQNDPPSFRVQETVVEAPEDAGAVLMEAFVFDVTSGSVYENNQVLTWNCTSSAPELFDVQPDMRYRNATTADLVFTPAPEAVGVSLVTCNVTDNVLPVPGWSVEVFSIRVTEVNDPPIIDIPVDKAAMLVFNQSAVLSQLVNIENFLVVHPGPPSEADQQISVNCSAEHPDMFSTPPRVTFRPSGLNDHGLNGTLTFVIARSLSMAAAGRSDITCDFLDTGSPQARSSSTFRVDLLFPDSVPAEEALYVNTPEYQSSPAYYATPEGRAVYEASPRYLTSPEYYDTPEGQAAYQASPAYDASPAFKAAPEGKDRLYNSPAFKASPAYDASPEGVDEYRSTPEFLASPAYDASPAGTAERLASPEYKGTPQYKGSPAADGAYMESPAYIASPAYDASPEGQAAFLASPAFKASPVAKDETPLGQYMRSPVYRASPDYKADSPIYEFWATPQGELSPSYITRNNIDVARTVLRLELRQRSLATFNLTDFGTVIDRAVAPLRVLATYVYWVCPGAACPQRACPAFASQRTVLGCLTGDTYHERDEARAKTPQRRGASGMQFIEETVVVDFDVETVPAPGDEQKTEYQKIKELEDRLEADLARPNSYLRQYGGTVVSVEDCGECTAARQRVPAPTTASEDDGFGDEWWHWFLVALGALLLLCCILLVLYLCCGKKKKEAREKEPAENEDKELEPYEDPGVRSPQTDDQYLAAPPEAGRLGYHDAAPQYHEDVYQPRSNPIEEFNFQRRGSGYDGMEYSTQVIPEQQEQIQHDEWQPYFIDLDHPENLTGPHSPQ